MKVEQADYSGRGFALPVDPKKHPTMHITWEGNVTWSMEDEITDFKNHQTNNWPTLLAK